jgi:hypothetical protein
MATTATPMGLEPIGFLSGRPFNGPGRQMKIASGYATSIFAGDVVKMVNDGTIAKDTGTATLTPVGVFMGVSYTDPTLGFIQREYWPASTVASDAYAYIADDPDLMFRVQASGTVAQTSLFNNAGVVQTAGSTLIGRSKLALDQSSIATTNTLPLKIIDFLDRNLAGDAFTDLVVIWNAGMHQYRVATGV